MTDTTPETTEAPPRREYAALTALEALAYNEYNRATLNLATHVSSELLTYPTRPSMNRTDRLDHLHTEFQRTREAWMEALHVASAYYTEYLRTPTETPTNTEEN